MQHSRGHLLSQAAQRRTVANPVLQGANRGACNIFTGYVIHVGGASLAVAGPGNIPVQHIIDHTQFAAVVLGKASRPAPVLHPLAIGNGRFETRLRRGTPTIRLPEG